MEGEALQEARFLGGPFLRRRVVEAGQPLHHADGVRPEGLDVFRGEETAPQDLRHVFLLDRLHPFLALAPEHVEQPRHQRAAELPPLLAGIGRQQRGHDGRPVHLGDRLGQILEEVLDAAAPDRVDARLLAGVHQHLVHQDQRRQAAFLRLFDQLPQQGFGRRRFALLVPAVGVDHAQPFRAGQLEGQHAPRVAQGALLPVRRAHVFDAPFGVDLVEAQGHREGARQIGADMAPELPDRRQVGQRLWVSEQVVERDQRVGLAAAIGQLQLADRLVAPPVEAKGHVLHQFPQRVRRVGEREERLRVFVDRPAPLPQGHFVQVGGELRQRERAAAQLVFQADDLMPGLDPVLRHRRERLTREGIRGLRAVAGPYRRRSPDSSGG